TSFPFRVAAPTIATRYSVPRAVPACETETAGFEGELIKSARPPCREAAAEPVWGGTPIAIARTRRRTCRAAPLRKAPDVRNTRSTQTALPGRESAGKDGVS